MTAARESLGIDPSLVTGVISSGFPTLRFPSVLESLFEKETGPSRSLQLVVRGIAGIVLSILVLFADWQLTPDVFGLALWLRLGVVSPLAFAIVFLLLRNPPAWLRETMVCAICILASLSSLGLMHLSHSPLRDGQHNTVILVILFITMVQRVRFPYAVATCLAICCIYAIALLSLDGYAPGRSITNTMVFAFAVVLALIASYSLEHELRLSYLLGLRERLRNNELRTLSRSDPLTGLGNRRALDEAMTVLQLAATGGEDVAVLLLDIDHFKAYNDALGHQAGDLCLQRIAAILRDELRMGRDEVFRFGGEEFLVVLRRTDLAGALAAGERMRDAIESAMLPHPETRSGILTASFGAAATVVGAGVAADELIASADSALYAAKRAGRNQVWPRLRPLDRSTSRLSAGIL